ELGGIGILQRDRILAAAFVLTERDQRWGLQEDHQAWNLHKLHLQLADDAIHLRAMLVIFQADEQKSLILASKTARSRYVKIDPRILADDIVYLSLQPHHLVERCIFGRFGAAKRKALVYRRHKS